VAMAKLEGPNERSLGLSGNAGVSAAATLHEPNTHFYIGLYFRCLASCFSMSRGFPDRIGCSGCGQHRYSDLHFTKGGNSTLPSLETFIHC
jgi:hypothetical protein